MILTAPSVDFTRIGMRPAGLGPRLWGHEQFRPLPVVRTPRMPINRRAPWHRTRPLYRARNRRTTQLEGLDGLGNFLKKVHKAVRKVALAPVKLISPKLASNLEKIDNKVIEAADKINDKVTTFAKKNMKWIIIAAAIAITIYSMGTGATLAAKMISGMKALGGLAKAGAAKVGSIFTGGSKTATLAMTAAQKLVGGQKVSQLSAEERLAYGEAANAGMLPMNDELQNAMGLRVVNKTPEDLAAEAAERNQGGGGGDFPRSEMPSWVMPAAIAGGALLLVMVLKK